MDKQIKIALAGNPNCGKTTLFNALTGSNQFVGNWPGVTVEKKEGKLKKHDDVVIMDLPGIYSLSPYTLEEVVARNYLIGERPDAILNIIDGTNLERNLYLTTQLTVGVQKCCVLHAPEYGCALDNEGNYAGQPSLNLPDGYIAGTVGAGDSFCAGILYAVYKKLSMNEALKIAVATAAANLSAEDSIGGLRNIEETMKLYDTYSSEK